MEEIRLNNNIVSYPKRGPIVDTVNSYPNTDAANILRKWLLEQTSKTYRTPIYRKLCAKHAWDVVLALRKFASYPDLKTVPWIDIEPYVKNEETDTKLKPVPQRSLFDF